MFLRGLGPDGTMRVESDPLQCMGVEGACQIACGRIGDGFEDGLPSLAERRGFLQMLQMVLGQSLPEPAAYPTFDRVQLPEPRFGARGALGVCRRSRGRGRSTPTAGRSPISGVGGPVTSPAPTSWCTPRRVGGGQDASVGCRA